MALPVTDAFTAADGTALATYNSNWQVEGGFAIESNRAIPTIVDDCYAHWHGDVFGADQYSKAAIFGMTNSARYRGVTVRCSGTGATFSCYVYDTDGASGSGHTEIAKVTNGAYTLLKSVAMTFADGDVIELRCTGAATTTLAAYKNGVLVDSITDSSSPHTSGVAGIHGYDIGVGGLDNWEAGNLGDTPLAAAANDVAAASAALSTQVRLGASAADASSSSAAMTTAIPLAAAAIDNAAATGVFASGALMNAQAFDVVTAVAALATQVRLAGAASDAAAASGALTNWATVTLVGDLYTGQGGVLDPDFWVDSVPQLGTTLYYDPTHITIYPNAEISSNTDDCTAIVQFFDGSSWALGFIVITPQLAAIAKAQASVGAQLSTAIQLAAAADALATAAAAFSTGAGLTAEASDAVSAGATLQTGVPLSALAQNVASASAALTAQIRLLAGASSSSAAHADLNGIVVLNAAASALSAVSGDLTTGVALGGAALGAAGAVGSITTQVRMTGAAQDAASAIGALSTSIALGGAANDSVNATGDLRTARLLTAAAIDAVFAAAQLATGIDLAANADSITTASGSLQTITAMLAGAASQTTVTAVLTDVIETPPIGAYVIDPAYLISRSDVDAGQTPRFPAMDPLATTVLTFDLSDQLGEEETLTGKVTLQIACIAGMDGNSTAMLLGVPSYDRDGKKILQPVHGGLDGSTYYLKVAAAATHSPRVVTLAALLPVRA